MKDKESTESAPASTHQRSPNYPACSLLESVNDARKVFEAEKRSVLNPESLARALGYGGLNGRSRTKIAAMRKYGLIDNIGEGAQISQLAMRILHQQEGVPDYLAALQEAATRPEVFKDFLNTHREASEQSIASELLVKRGYSPEGAKAFAKSFRETIVFAKLDKEGYSSPDAENKNKADSGNGRHDSPKPPAAKPPVTGTIQPGELPVPIAEGLVARVPYPMSEDDFELLIETLKLWKKKLVRKLASIPPAVSLPADAVWTNGDNDKPVRIVALMGERDGEQYFQSDDGTGIPSSQLKFS